jgi:glutamate carboxypeptidase
MEQIKDKVISLSEHYAQEQLDFVIDICNQNSYSYHKNGIDGVAKKITDVLEGIMPLHEIRKQEQLGDHHLLKNLPSAQTSTRAIYLVGHMDTVFPPDHPFQECQLHEDLLVGPGTGDMKGGLAVFVYSLKILKDIDFLNRLKLVLILNSDEEIGSISSRSIFLEEREKAMLCLVAECAGLHNEIVVSRNGKMAVLVKNIGQGNHVGRSTSGKSSAILEMAQKIIELESLNGYLPGVSVNVGKIVTGGLGAASVPAEASFFMDVRWEDKAHKEAMLSKIKTILTVPSHPGCRSEFEIVNSRPLMPANNNDGELSRMIQQVGKSLGQEITLEHRRGTSDANFFGSFGVPTLDGFGPIADKDHTPEEFIKISSLKERTALLTMFLLEYGRRTGMIS